MLTMPRGDMGFAPSSLFNGREADNSSPGVMNSRRVRSALLDSISRDVARPLASIVRAAASLRKRGRAHRGSLEGDLIDIIENEAARLERFASLLLDMAKLECDVVAARAETVAIKDVVGVAVRDAAGALGSRKTDISLPARGPMLRSDPAILRRVLLLLIENAAAESPLDSTVSIQVESAAEAVRLRILDEGDGIPPGDADKIFRQLHLPSADEPSPSPAGMQLTVCRRLVELLGGTITAANRTDRSGAVFAITLPVLA